MSIEELAREAKALVEVRTLRVQEAQAALAQAQSLLEKRKAMLHKTLQYAEAVEGMIEEFGPLSKPLASITEKVSFHCAGQLSLFVQR